MGSVFVWSSSLEKFGNNSQSRKCGAERFWKMQKKVTRLETGGRWQHEYKEELELLRHSNDLCLAGVLLRQACDADKASDWANYLEVFPGSGMLRVWTSAKLRECDNEMEQEDEDREGIVQDMRQQRASNSSK